MKQQFNVYLTTDLVARIKHRAIDLQMSLSDLTAQAIEAVLENPMTPPSEVLALQPIVHVKDMSAAIKFYEALGAELVVGSRDGDWAQLRFGGTELGLLARPANPEQSEGDVELCFECGSALGPLEHRLASTGVEIVRGAADEAFGEQLQVRSPDGLLIKINRLDPATFA